MIITIKSIGIRENWPIIEKEHWRLQEWQRLGEGAIFGTGTEHTLVEVASLV